MTSQVEDRVALRNLGRRIFLDELLLLGDIPGRMDLTDFLGLTWDLEAMPSTDSRFKTAAGDIWQHMINNDDWSYSYLFVTYLGLVDGPDEQLLRFLEHVVHPTVRTSEEQPKYIAFINSYLAKEGFELRLRDEIAGFQVYRAAKIGAEVSDKVKNIIFASNGPKPRIVLSDALSNDIAIVENQQHCLVYDKPLPQQGLLWSDLVSWWAERGNVQPTIETERALFKRLRDSLSQQSPPERTLFETYFKSFREELGSNFPALIPQVYLHYDPYTIKELRAGRYLIRQRMDFLLLFSHHQRVVIEVDGVQHYSDEKGTPSPERYAEMVAADRDLRLVGYEVYRFGGFELQEPTACERFFRKLFQKHGLWNGRR